MHISIARGSVWTEVPICTVQSAEGATIDLALHYDSSRADASVSWRQTVLGYGWTHNYNIYLVVRSQIVFLSDATGRMTGFRQRFDGGYTSSPGDTHTLSRVDADTFLLEKVDGRKLTFELFDPPPWPEAGQLFQLTRIEDAQGRITTLSHNAQDLLETITDPYGRQVSLTYNANKRIETVTNADSEVTQIEYANPDDDLWRITDPEAHTLEYTYDSQNRMRTEKLKDGNTWTAVYSNGKPRQLIDGDGQVQVTVTNDDNWAIDLDHALQFDELRYVPSRTTVTDGCGNETISHYDSNACITTNGQPGHPDETYEYDDDLRLVERCDEENNCWAYEYDAYGNRTRGTDPLGNVTLYEYNTSGIGPADLLTKKTEPDGDEWLYDYDSNGNLTREIDPLYGTNGPSMEYEYDGLGHLTRTTDRNGHVTTRDYNTNGTLLRETVDPGGLDVITEYEYDAAGRPTRRTLYRGPGLTDPIVTTYVYDAMGRLTAATRDPGGLNLVTSNGYDGAGRRTRVTNPRGVITEYEYDARGRLIRRSTDPGGLNLTTRYEYDGCDNQNKVIDPKSNETTYEYDDRNRLTKTIDAEGYWTLYEYDDRGNQRFVRRSIDPGGPPYRVTESQYDALSRRTHGIVDPGGLNLTTVFDYGTNGTGGACPCPGTPGSSLIHKVTDPEGMVTYYYYDALDRRVSDVRKVADTADNGGDADDAVTTYEYDYMFNRTRVTVENAPGTDPVTEYAYDAADRQTRQVAGPGGSNLVTSNGYDGAGNVIEQTTPVGNVITRAYDKADRLTGESDSLCGAGENIATYTYDENGNVLTQTDALGHTWAYTYDAADRQTTACDPLVEVPDKCTSYEYDDNGNLTRMTDNEGLVTTNGYDGLDRRTSMTKAPPSGVDVTITYAYDGAGNQTRITDDNGNASVYEYDDANRLRRELYADGTDVLFTYTDAGNVASRTDQMDNVTSYTYDDLHRLTMRDYAEETPLDRADTFTYDRAGRMLTADNEHSHIGYSYDDVGRVTSGTQTDLPQTYSYAVGYAYSTVPNTRTLTYPSGKAVQEVRDVRNRLTEVWQDGVKTVWYTYDLANRVLTKTFNNGTEARYGYNDNDWITALRHVGTNGIDTFAGFAHDYDAVGNRLNAKNLQGVIPYDDARPVTHSEKYGYDGIYRLTNYQRGQWVGGDIPPPRRQRTWQLDGVHNWTQFGITDANDPGQDGTYCNSINQMNEYDDPSNDGPPPVPDDDGLPDDFMAEPCPPLLLGDFDNDGDVDLDDFAALAAALGGPGSPAARADLPADLDGDGDVDLRDFGLFQSSYTGPAAPRAASTNGFNRAHDKNGNLVDDGQREYFYDYTTSGNAALRTANRLTMVKDKGTGNILGQYWYDALGRRIRKLANGVSTNGVSTVYVYTNDWRAIEEHEDGVLARNYAYGDWIDEVLTMDRAGEADRFYYHANALDSIIAVTDDAGAPAERYTYDAYGEPSFFDSSGTTIPQSEIGNPYLFTGRRYDPETSLYYYRTRYLDPSAGRFTTRDTIGIWADGSNLGNAYTYGRNNAPAYVDPLALSCTRGTDVVYYEEPGTSGDTGVTLSIRQENSAEYGETKFDFRTYAACWTASSRVFLSFRKPRPESGVDKTCSRTLWHRNVVSMSANEA